MDKAPISMHPTEIQRLGCVSCHFMYPISSARLCRTWSLPALQLQQPWLLWVEREASLQDNPGRRFAGLPYRIPLSDNFCQYFRIFKRNLKASRISICLTVHHKSVDCQTVPSIQITRCSRQVSCERAQQDVRQVAWKTWEVNS